MSSVTGAADLAGVDGREERADHELARLYVRDVRADFFDDADVLVAHRRWPLPCVGAAVGPEVAAADAGANDADDRVCRLDDRRLRDILDANVARSVHECPAHQ
jgi:hypothetical protein